ncbi:MAG: 1-acyl-sn-glycerol-3-phosphate acyltransferase [Porticoccaceae bacterium]
MNKKTDIKPGPESPLQVDIPASAPRRAHPLLAWIGFQGLRLLGWKISGGFVDQPKLIAVVAPHSSNWDWIIGVCGLWALELRFCYLIKKQAMIWPVSLIINRTGGIPIDRARPIGVVEQLVNEFHASEKLWYAITPEGTRKSVSRWKNGFLRVAYDAGVPVVPVSIDYPSRQINVGEPFDLSGDIDMDLDIIRRYFEPFAGRNRS